MAKRRAKGEGSLYQRKDGRYVAELDLGVGEDGKRKRKPVYGRTQREALEKRDSLQALLKQGVQPAPERFTVGELLDQWLTESVRPSVKPKTYVSYEQIVRLYLKPFLGKIRLNRLQPLEVQVMLNQLAQKDLSATTVAYALRVARIAFEQALRWGMLPRNPAKFVAGVRVERKEITPFTVEEARQVLKAVKGDRLEALFTVALAMGLRQGEAFALRWDDINFENPSLSVRHTLERIGKNWRFAEPKSERSRRTIPLPVFALSALHAHRLQQKFEKELAGTHWTDHNLVFTSTVGTPLDSPNVTKRFKRLIEAAGLPVKRFHDLRHTCGTMLAAQGVHHRTIMDILGHSQISETMRYTHALENVKISAMSEVESLLSPTVRALSGSPKTRAVS